jgi:hypothetical protein
MELHSLSTSKAVSPAFTGDVVMTRPRVIVSIACLIRCSFAVPFVDG